MQKTDVLIIGAGIVGLAIAYKLLLRKGTQVTLLEKEAQVAQHQSGHNSGVIHTGIYYKPGSLKATLCVEGGKQLRQFCAKHNVPIQSVGKLIIATSQEEIPALEELQRRGDANGVKGLKRVKGEEISAIEPLVTEAVQGLHSPETSIVDFGAVSRALLFEIQQLGGTLLTKTPSQRILQHPDHVIVETPQGEIAANQVINCAGVWADDVAKQSGLKLAEMMIPFRGDYFRLSDRIGQQLRGLIYPVPDPAFPFLGVHLTRLIHGEVEAGPNAVLALAKDGYSKTALSPSHLLHLLSYPGFWKMATKYWKTGIYEFKRSLNKSLFVQSLQKLVPCITSDDLLPGGAGIRAQLVNPDGSLCDDFRIVESPRILHLLNAPSPAATASLAIADHILSRCNFCTSGSIQL